MINRTFLNSRQLGTALLILVTMYCCKSDDDEASVPTPVLTVTISGSLSAPNEITLVSETNNGDVENVDHGYVWSTHPQPTTADEKFRLAGAWPSYTLSRLDMNVTYYIRAYITQDNLTTYSNELSLTTAALELDSFSPKIASCKTEVIIRGKNIPLVNSGLYLNGTRVHSKITDTTIVFTPPCHLAVDSLLIEVGVNDQRTSFKTKLRYLNGWTQVKGPDDFFDSLNYVNGVKRSLSVNGKGYINFFDGPLRQNILEYDPSSDSWTKKTNLPFNASFFQWIAADNKIFVLKDTTAWVYDPVADRWNSSPPIPNRRVSEYNALGLTINSVVYFLICDRSIDNRKTELWKFNHETSQWSQASSCPVYRSFGEGLALSVGNSAYMLDDGINFPYTNENWQYNAVNDTWTRRADYPGNAAVFMAGFAAFGKLYIGCGGTNNKEFWEYDPITDKWTQLEDFVSERDFPYYFFIDNSGYVGGSVKIGAKINDLWKFNFR